MTIFCTYCSKQKRHDAELLPAIARYQSARIARVFASAECLGLGFLILSGQYGLIGAGHPIPEYDHLLAPSEVSQLAGVAADQLKRHHASQVVYVTRSPEAEPNAAPYRDTIVAAAAECSVPLCIVEIEEEAVSRWTEIMQAADTARAAMVAGRPE